jgi:mannose-6-phosphate isomerase
MMLDPERKRRVADEARGNIRYFRNDPGRWLTVLLGEYPGDIMFLAPFLFNLVRLNPGEAIFLGPGEFHAYLEGVGIELMANSDNVLRGGLTEKHVDLDELLKIASFVPKAPERIAPVVLSDCEKVYPVPAEAFSLSVLTISEKKAWSGGGNGVEIVLCIEGSGGLTTPRQPEGIALGKGRAILVPAAAERYSLQGNGRFYRAMVPAGKNRPI